MTLVVVIGRSALVSRYVKKPVAVFLPLIFWPCLPRQGYCVQILYRVYLVA
jgi:hypothetical protein